MAGVSMEQVSEGKNARRLLAGSRTGMLGRVAWWVRLGLWWFFAKVDFDERLLARLREAAGRGRIVYALPSRSLFDYLYFNYAFRKHRLPLARWSNGVSTVMFRPMWNALRWVFGRRGVGLSEVEQFGRVLEGTSEGCAAVFLERPRATDAENEAYSLPYFLRLVALAGEEGRGVLQVVPLRVIWERRAEEAQSSLLDDLFGGRQRPGFFRKVFHALSNVWQPFFMMGKPLVQVGQILEVEPVGRDSDVSDADAARALRTKTLQQLDQVLAVVVGPRMKGSAMLKAEILQDPLFITKLDKIIENTSGAPVTREGLSVQAKRNLDKIAAEFSMATIKFMGAALTPVWRTIYDGLDVDQESLERVRETAREKRIILIPSHKSHIDYLILSYIFFQNGLLPPHIAAGDNLDFPPIGSLFRRSGAFFLRRSFKGDDLYTACLQHYLGKLIAEGYPVEFFIEGGRSRTGKLLSPRFGLLRMILDSFRERADIPSLAVVPCAVTYERVVEASGYQKELMGGQKKQENLGALLRSTRILTSRYGRLFVSFAPPIDLQEYIQRYFPKAADPDFSPGDEALQRLTQRLGYRVIYEINQAIAITPTSLTSLALLNHPTPTLTHDDLLASIGFVLRRSLQHTAQLSPSLKTALASRRAQLHLSTADTSEDLERIDADALASSAESHPDHSRSSPSVTALQLNPSAHAQRLAVAVDDLIREALKLFTDSKLVEVLSAPSSPTRYKIPEHARGELSYYKNTILHALAPEALLASALLSVYPSDAPDPAASPRDPKDIDSVLRRTDFLSRLFKFEFIYEERAEFENVFWRTFGDFESEGWIQRLTHTTPHKVRCSPPSAPVDPLQFFRQLARPLLEAYALTLTHGLNAATDWISERDLITHTVAEGRAMLAAGKLHSRESLAQPTLQNVLRLAEDWHLIESRSVEKLRRRVRQVRLSPTPEHAARREETQKTLRALTLHAS